MIRVRSGAARRAGRVATWALLLLGVLLLLQSAIWTPRLPPVLRITVPAVAALSAVSPGAGLIAVALLAPLDYVVVTRVFPAYPFALGEGLVLAFFAGYLWAKRRSFLDPPLQEDSLAVPASVFTLIVIAACLEHLRVLQLWHDDPLTYATDLVRLLRSDYLTDNPDPRPWIDGRGFLHVPALLLEGIALMRCARTLCAARPTLMVELAAALAASASIVAALSLPGPLGYARESHVGLWVALTSRRWSSWALPSLNAAGAFFLLAGFIATAVAVESRRLRLPAAVAALATFGAMWLTQTRSAVVAALVVVTSVVVWVAGQRLTGWSTRRLALAAGSIALVAGLLVIVVNPFGILARGAQRSLLFRLRFAQTGLRMLSSAPLTGVGPGQYVPLYTTFATPEALALDRRPNNAHNYLLWLAAELGLLGLASFVWLLGTALVEASRGLRSPPVRFRLVLLAGLAAFIITWAAGQPIDLPIPAIVFWVALGIAATPGAESPQPPSTKWIRRPAGSRLALFVFAIALAVTLPARWNRVTASVDLARVRYGFHNEGDAGRRFVWAGPRATFFQPSTVPAVELGVAALHPETPHGVRLRIRVDGREQAPVVLPPGEWLDVRLRPAPDAWRESRFWRVDLEVRPIDVPDQLPESERRVAISGFVPVPVWEAER